MQSAGSSNGPPASRASGHCRKARRTRRPTDRTANTAAEPLHPAALLVDQHRRFGVSYAIAQFADEPRDLRWRINVALEKDKAPRPFRADKFALGSGQFQSGYAGNKCAALHG